MLCRARVGPVGKPSIVVSPRSLPPLWDHTHTHTHIHIHTTPSPFHLPTANARVRTHTINASTTTTTITTTTTRALARSTQARGHVVAVFGKGRLGLSMTDSGDVMEIVPEADRARRPQLAHMHASAPVVPGMEILRVGHIHCRDSGWNPGEIAKELTAMLQSAPRPVQIVFGHPSTEKIEAARKLQEMRKRQNEMRAARREVDRRRELYGQPACAEPGPRDGVGHLLSQLLQVLAVRQQRLTQIAIRR